MLQVRIFVIWVSTFDITDSIVPVCLRPLECNGFHNRRKHRTGTRTRNTGGLRGCFQTLSGGEGGRGPGEGKGFSRGCRRKNPNVPSPPTPLPKERGVFTQFLMPGPRRAPFEKCVSDFAVEPRTGFRNRRTAEAFAISPCVEGCDRLKAQQVVFDRRQRKRLRTALRDSPEFSRLDRLSFRILQRSAYSETPLPPTLAHGDPA